MIELYSTSFLDSLYYFLTKTSTKRKSTIVKANCDNFKEFGDFSFPLNIDPWKLYVNNDFLSEEVKTIFDFCQITYDYEDHLRNESENWCLKIKDVYIRDERVLVYLDKGNTFWKCIGSALKTEDAIKNKLSTKSSLFQIENINSHDITTLRMQLIKDVVENLACITYESIDQIPNLYFTSKSSDKGPAGSICILAGVVVNLNNGKKETNCLGDNYIKKRQVEMEMIAQHKYGLRISRDARWSLFISQLGKAAAAYDLLQVKPTSAVKLTFANDGSGSSKGAAFVLYNCARLATLLQKFNQKVKESIYPHLPKVDEIDFNLLTDEDEWNLLFNYVLGFPVMLNSCLTLENGNCRLCPHHLCSFLSSMARMFSLYYRRIRILTECRDHLLPVMFARIYLVKALHSILSSCLSILNIQPVTQM